jgi:very-short-patch-repair endonuclease
MKYNHDIVASYFRQCGLPEPVFEWRFHPTRKWRLDLAFIDQRVCLEVQGGIFIQGRHSRGAAMLKEWEKLNTLATMGWRVLYCQPKDVCTTEIIELIRMCLKNSC